MATKSRSVGSHKLELVKQAREAAIAAVSIFNSPQIHFKTENFIVLMIIAWTYAFHAYFRKIKVDYRWRDPKKPTRILRTSYGKERMWGLSECLNYKPSPLPEGVIENLNLILGVRHEIEHEMTRQIDSFMMPKLISLAMNFNNFLKTEFGSKYSLDDLVSISIQFAELVPNNFSGISNHPTDKRLHAYLMHFENDKNESMLNDPNYQFKLIFTRQLVKKENQADQVLEFAPASSNPDASRNTVFIQERDKERYLRKDIVQLMKDKGYINFRGYEFEQLVKKHNARDRPEYGGKLAMQQYWFRSWIKVCIEHCEQHHLPKIPED